MSRLTVNPFEVMRRAYGDKLQFPRPLRGDRSEEALLSTLYPEGRSSGRLFVVEGLPGVGKTHRLMSDLATIRKCYGSSRDFRCYVTSIYNTTVDEVNAREKAASSGRKGAGLHKTIHKLAWHHMDGKKSGGQVDVQYRAQPKYRTEPFDPVSLDQYVWDAGYHDRAHQEVLGAFKAWDPLTENLPHCLRNPRLLPPKCGFDYTLYQVCRDHETWLEDRGLRAMAYAPVDGVLFIDEAQDLSPLQAITMGHFALSHNLAIRAYGDPGQMIDQDREMPFIWDQGGQIEQYFGHPAYRRVPLAIAKLAEMTMPGLVAPAEKWCKRDDLNRPILGQVIARPTAANKKGENAPGLTPFSVHLAG